MLVLCNGFFSCLWLGGTGLPEVKGMEQIRTNTWELRWEKGGLDLPLWEAPGMWEKVVWMLGVEVKGKGS